MRKKIIFGAPVYFDLHKMMIKNLENAGFDVFSIAMDEDFKYENLILRAKNLLKKKILRDKNYKRRVLYYNYKQKQLEPILSKFNKDTFDYALIIRPDIYPFEILKHLNNISITTIAYQWDGVDRFTGVIDRIPLFDKFFVFDKRDFIKYKHRFDNLYITNNFYCNYEPEATEKKSDVYYLGAIQNNRINELRHIISFIDVNKYILNISILSKRNESDSVIKFITAPLSYDQNLENVKNTKVLIDLKVSEHDGLSFRFFECLKYEIKIITTNKTVRNYDFYNPNNIFIIDIDDNKDLSNFIESDYETVNNKTYNSYSFKNWISKLID